MFRATGYQAGGYAVVVCPLASAVLQSKGLLGETGMEGAAHVVPGVVEDLIVVRGKRGSFRWADVWDGGA